MRRSFGPGLGFGMFLIANLDKLLLEVKLGSWIEVENERVIHVPRLSWLAVYGFDCYCFWHCDFSVDCQLREIGASIRSAGWE